MYDSYVSAALYCRANLYTWFINIKDNQHKGVTAQFIQYGSKTAMTGSLTLIVLIDFKTSKSVVLVTSMSFSKIAKI